jgi:hypothetical protein
MSDAPEADAGEDPPPDGLSVEMNDRDLSDAFARSVSSGAAPPHPDAADGDLEAHLDAMVNRFVAPPPEARPAVLQLLNRRRVDALVASDYEGAELQDKYRWIFSYSVKLEMERMSDNHRVDQLYQRWLQLQRDQDEINGAWDERMSAFSREDQQKYDEMCAAHQNDMGAFEAFWRDPLNLRAFTKPSGRLLELRKQEKAMGVARLYQRAKEMKQFADKVQRDETVAAQARIVQRMAADRDRLLASQEGERNRHLVHRRAVLTAMEYERNEALRPVLTAIAQLRAKRGARRAPAAPVSRPGHDGAVQTPRTQRRYAAYRAEEIVPRLEVQPVDAAPPARSAQGRRSPALPESTASAESEPREAPAPTPSPEPEAQPEAAAEPGPEPEPDAQPEAAAEPEPEPEPGEREPEAEAEPEPEPEPDPPPEAADSAAPETAEEPGASE